MARFLRPKINNRLPEYLIGFPNICEQKYTGKIKLQNEIKDLDDVSKCFTPIWDVPEVKWGEGPGERAALSMLLNFIKEKLKFYGISSNDPGKDHTSRLSPWIRFGK